MIHSAAVSAIESLLGPRGYLHRPEDLTLYEYDGSVDKARPDLVVFPQIHRRRRRASSRSANEYGIPIVGRGAGTGLSGGAIPRAGGIVIGFARMNRILEIDLENERAVVQPGVVNLDITQAVAEQTAISSRPILPASAPAPSAATWRRTAGGPHTLAYGVTTNHVLGLEAGAARRHGDRDRRQGRSTSRATISPVC